MAICRITPVLPGLKAADFQEHLVYSPRTIHVTPQTKSLVKMRAAQEETSGMSWNQCLVLSSKALPHQVYESAWLSAGALQNTLWKVSISW